MNHNFKNNRNLFFVLGEWWEARQSIRAHTLSTASSLSSSAPVQGLWRLLRWFMPNGGTLLIVAVLIATQHVWASPTVSNVPGPSATTINYQGRLANNTGTPLTGTYAMTFAIYDAPTAGNVIWGPETFAAVQVSNGLFNVGLGSQTAGGIPTTVWNGDRYLETSVGGESLSPRELIRSVPLAGMALTVPDGSITTAKLGPDVNLEPPPGSITTTMLANGAVTLAKVSLPATSYFTNTEFSTTSSSFVAIPSSSVTVTLETSGKLFIVFAGDMNASCGGCGAEMAVVVDGQLKDPPKIELVNAPAGLRVTGSQSLILNANAGTHIIQLYFRTFAGTATVGHRSLSVLVVR